MSTFLWVIVPYLSLTTFIVGHFWRYRYDKFGWTTRSSQLYEDKLLRIGSPLFHFGMLGVVFGHILGLVIPNVWTDALGISAHTYHIIALAGGIPAGLATLVGLISLVYRRRTTGPVFSATTVNDKVMYFFLGLVIILGMWNTIAGSLLRFALGPDRIELTINVNGGEDPFALAPATLAAVTYSRSFSPMTAARVSRAKCGW